MIEHDDRECVSQCLAGNTGAFEVLVERYYKQVFNIAYRMTNNNNDSEDITQTVFIKVYEKLDMYNPKYKFFSWIYRIAVNETLNHLTQNNRIEGLNRDYISQDKTPEESYEEMELSDKLQDALMCLGLEYKSLIVLKHFQYLSYREIAFILDIPEKKVKSRLFTARHLLRDVLSERGIELNDR